MNYSKIATSGFCIYLATQIPPIQGRQNPRVIKKPRSKFSSKKPIHRGLSRQSKQLTFSIFNSA